MGLKSFVKTLAVGAGAGAAAVWFADPERGAERRRQAVQRVTSTVGEARGVVEQAKDQVEEAREQVADRAGTQEGQPGERTLDLDAGQAPPRDPEDLIVPTSGTS